MIIQDGGKQAWQEGYTSAMYGQPKFMGGIEYYTEWYSES